MQNKSINNAFVSLRKDIVQRDLDGLAHVEALLAMRGVELPNVMVRSASVAKRGHMRRMVLGALRGDPMTRRQLVHHIPPLRPNVPPDRLYWRVNAALSKLKAKGRIIWQSGQHLEARVE